MDWVEISGFVAGLLGLGYALYQGTEHHKLQRFVRSQNWHLYSKENNANGALQRAISLYKEHHKTNLSPEVLEMLGRADAWGQDVFKDTVRQIQLAEKKFSNKIIDKWVQEGKVTPEHAKALFRSLVVDA